MRLRTRTHVGVSLAYVRALAALTPSLHTPRPIIGVTTAVDATDNNIV